MASGALVSDVPDGPAKEAGIVAGEHVFVERVSMILRKGNPELKEQLNRGLAEIMKNGTYQALSQKYFKTDASCK